MLFCSKLETCPGNYTNVIEGSAYCYKFVETSKAWLEAFEHCREDNGYLVEIWNQEENSGLTDFVRKNTAPYYPVYTWIGINETHVDKRVWQPYGRPVKYTNWHSGEPNNFNGQENCASINTKYGSRLGKWNDDRCERELPFLCMKPKG